MPSCELQLPASCHGLAARIQPKTAPSPHLYKHLGWPQPVFESGTAFQAFPSLSKPFQAFPSLSKPFQAFPSLKRAKETKSNRQKISKNHNGVNKMPPSPSHHHFWWVVCLCMFTIPDHGSDLVVHGQGESNVGKVTLSPIQGASLQSGHCDLPYELHVTSRVQSASGDGWGPLIKRSQLHWRSMAEQNPSDPFFGKMFSSQNTPISMRGWRTYTKRQGTTKSHKKPKKNNLAPISSPHQLSFGCFGQEMHVIKKLREALTYSRVEKVRIPCGFRADLVHLQRPATCGACGAGDSLVPHPVEELPG